MTIVVARPTDETRLQQALARAPIVLLTGPRQAGKSTLARQVVEPPASNLFDLEDPRDLARLGEPTMSLPSLHGTIVIDEAQRRPDLFPVLRVLADEAGRPGRFLVLGSASPELVGMASESLAGRVAMVELAGFRLADLRAEDMQALWLRGGLPRSFLAPDDQISAEWRDDYIATFLERDLANLGFRLPAATMRRFWTMLAHYHAQTWHGAELARALDVSESTVRRYLDALSDALVVRQLQPWFANISKRQVRAPKIYIRDPGLVHRLLGIATVEDLLGHPKVGASWEGFVIEQLLQMELREPWFWATHAGAELDLLVTAGKERIGIEVKRTDQPRLTPSIRHALADLGLRSILVVHAGRQTFPLADHVVAVDAQTALREGIPSLLTRWDDPHG